MIQNMESIGTFKLEGFNFYLQNRADDISYVNTEAEPLKLFDRKQIRLPSLLPSIMILSFLVET